MTLNALSLCFIPKMTTKGFWNCPSVTYMWQKNSTWSGEAIVLIGNHNDLKRSLQLSKRFCKLMMLLAACWENWSNQRRKQNTCPHTLPAPILPWTNPLFSCASQFLHFYPKFHLPREFTPGNFCHSLLHHQWLALCWAQQLANKSFVTYKHTHFACSHFPHQLLLYCCYSHLQCKSLNKLTILSPNLLPFPPKSNTIRLLLPSLIPTTPLLSKLLNPQLT